MLKKVPRVNQDASLPPLPRRANTIDTLDENCLHLRPVRLAEEKLPLYPVLASLHLIWLHASRGAWVERLADVLLKVISLQFHPTVMASEGEIALENLYAIAEEYKGKFSLAVEGSIPVAANGKYCIVGEMKHKEITMMDLVKDLGAKAGSVLAVGTCAAYGGIPAAKGNETGATGVMKFFKTAGIKTPVVNIPGCPPHPDWIVGSIAHLLTKGLPELDDNGRPKVFFGENIHDNCSHVKEYDAGTLSAKLSDPKGCRIELGCKGPGTFADCYKRKWNSGLNWCVDNAVCIGCVEPGFPDATSPFYEPA